MQTNDLETAEVKKASYRFDYLAHPSYKSWCEPILRRSVKNAWIFTISPPKMCYHETLELADGLKSILFQTRYYTVTEVDRMQRVHWHGVMNFQDGMCGDVKISQHLFAKLKAKCFADFQKPKNMTSWVVYSMKDVPYWDRRGGSVGQFVVPKSYYNGLATRADYLQNESCPKCSADLPPQENI